MRRITFYNPKWTMWIISHFTHLYWSKKYFSRKNRTESAWFFIKKQNMMPENDFNDDIMSIIFLLLTSSVRFLLLIYLVCFMGKKYAYFFLIMKKYSEKTSQTAVDIYGFNEFNKAIFGQNDPNNSSPHLIQRFNCFHSIFCLWIGCQNVHIVMESIDSLRSEFFFKYFFRIFPST